MSVMNPEAPPDDGWEPRSIEDRQERIAEIEARLAVMDEENANARMSDEDREEWNRLNAELDEHRATVKELQARKARLAANAANPEALVHVRTNVDVPGVTRRRGDEIYDLKRIRAESRSEDDHRDRLHDAAKRVVERSGYASSLVARMGGREEIQGHVEQLLDNNDDSSGTLAKQIIATGSPAYDRAFGKVVMFGAHVLNQEEQRAMSVGGAAGAEGGLAVPFQLDPSVLLTSAGTLSPLRQIARVEQITSKTWQGITSAGITVSRSAEGAEAGDNSFTIAQPTVSPTRVIAEVPFSVEIDQDWPQLRGEIARLLADAKTVEEDTAFVQGDGTGVNPFGIPKTLGVGSTVADGFSFGRADLYDLEAALPVRFRPRARFMANKGVYQAVRQLDTTGGADLWVRLAGSQPAELLGYPAHEASTMDAHTLTAGRYLLFGDFSNFLIVDRLGTLVEIMPHVMHTTTNRWSGQRALLAFWRNSSKILVDNAFRCLRHDT